MKHTRSMRNVLNLTILVLSLSMSVSCNSGDMPDSGDNVFKKIVLTKSQQRILEKGNQFAVSLMREYYNSDPTENILLSPMGATMLSCILANGAQGETYDDIVSTIGMNDFSINEINDYYATMSNALSNADKSVNLTLANSIWVSDYLSFRPSFKQSMQKVYGADVKNVDFFHSEKAAQSMNNWLKSKLGGQIENLYSEGMNPNTESILLNAVHFNGNWMRPFYKGDNTVGGFASIDGTSVETVFMNKIGSGISGYVDDEVSVCKMAYGNGAFEFMAVLPSSEDFSTFIAGITPEKTVLWNKVNCKSVQLMFPRMEVTYDSKDKMVQVLKNMGMVYPFDSILADFNMITSKNGHDKKNLSISEFFQRSSLSVDEKGTEVTLASLAAQVATYSPDEAYDSIVMNFDRPFLYLIREKSTGAILFMGTKVK